MDKEEDNMPIDPSVYHTMLMQSAQGAGGNEKPLTGIATTFYKDILKQTEYAQKSREKADQEMIDKKKEIADALAEVAKLAYDPNNPLTPEELDNLWKTKMATIGVSPANFNRIYPMASAMITGMARYGGEQVGGIAGSYFPRKKAAGLESVGMTPEEAAKSEMTTVEDLDRYERRKKAEAKAEAEAKPKPTTPYQWEQSKESIRARLNTAIAELNDTRRQWQKEEAGELGIGGGIVSTITARAVRDAQQRVVGLKKDAENAGIVLTPQEKKEMDAIMKPLGRAGTTIQMPTTKSRIPD